MAIQHHDETPEAGPGGPVDTAGPGGRPVDTAGPGGRPVDTAGPGGRPVDTAGPGGRPVDEAEVIAAIAAAVELCWPRPVRSPPKREPRPATPAWRFSGRWWSKPPQLRRDRPWAEP